MIQSGKRAAYPGLCGGIHSAGGIVEDEYLRVPEKGSGNAEPLFLAAGYVHAALAKIGIQPFWHVPEKFVRAGFAAGVPQFPVICVRVSPEKILADGSGEQDVFLQDNSHGVPKD